MSDRLLVWIDIENPPQVQYLVPFIGAFEAAGADVVVTARDYGSTLELLAAAGVDAHLVGAGYGEGIARKLSGLARRAWRLRSRFRGGRPPDRLLCAGRAALLVARRMGVPAFSIWDYEHADLTFDRLGRSYIVYPDVIGEEAFLRRGIKQDRLLPFPGLKEDFSYAGLDLDAIPAHVFAEAWDDQLTKVLYRPPAEDSHYYRRESGTLSRAVLERLAGDEQALVVFAPRDPRQASELDRYAWANRPIALERPLPFVSLLKAVDLVIASGGTMVREAAYLGVPAVSIFRGETGAVDEYLESLGRLQFVSSAHEINLAKRPRATPRDSDPALLANLADTILRLDGRRRRLRASFVRRS